MGIDINKEFSTEKYRMAEKCLKVSSTSIVIREMQIKTTLRFHLTPVRMAKIKNSGDSRCWQVWRKRNTPPLLVGLQAGTITLEISLAVPQKIGHSTTGGSSDTTPGHIPRRCSNI
jgi:predicted permease